MQSPRKKDSIVSYDFRLYLELIYKKKTKNNPAYSFRAFAKSLGTDATTLRKIISGKRPLGPKVIKNYGRKLHIADEQLEQFIQAHAAKKRLHTSAVPERLEPLDYEELEILATWYSYAILELMEVETFKGDIDWIAKALQLSVDEVQIALDLLWKKGWIIISKNGEWKKQIVHTTSSPLDPRTATYRIRLIKQIMHKACEALELFPREERSHTANTFAIDSRLLPEAIEKIRAFRADMSQFLHSTKKRDRVYQLAVALYPLSKNTGTS